MSDFDKFLKEKKNQKPPSSRSPIAAPPLSSPSLPPTTQSPIKWLPIYAVGSAILILVLIGLLFSKRSDTNQTSRTVDLAEPVVDTKARSAELEKQRETQAKMLEQQRIAAEQDARRQEQEMQRRATAARIQDLEQRLSAVRRSLAATQTEKAAHSTQVKSYAMNHKMAIAALGITVAGAGVALDASDKFSGDQKNVAAVSAVIAGLYAVSNHEECLEVADKMARAAVMEADYDSRIEDAQEQISAFQAQITKGRSALEEK